MTSVSRRTALMSLTAMAASACVQKQPPRNRLVIATGGTGGVYYTLGQALARVLRRRWKNEVEVLITSASIENLQRVARGTADIGFATLDAVALAVVGQPPFARPLPLSTLGQLYDDYVHLVTLAAASIRTLTDLNGQEVSVGATSSGTQLVTHRVLGLANARNIRGHSLGVSESAQALSERRIQAFFFSGGLPTPAIANLARQTAIRLLPLGKYVEGLRRRFSGVYLPRVVPGMTYGLPVDVPSVGIHNLLIVNDSMEPEVAYSLTRLLFESRAELAGAHAEAKRLHERTAISTAPAALHPGAIQYYRDAKFDVTK